MWCEKDVCPLQRGVWTHATIVHIIIILFFFCFGGLPCGNGIKLRDMRESCVDVVWMHPDDDCVEWTEGIWESCELFVKENN